jgi:hypothetical protein
METQHAQYLSEELVERLRVTLKDEFDIDLSSEDSQRCGSAWVRYLDLILSEQRKPPD